MLTKLLFYLIAIAVVNAIHAEEKIRISNDSDRYSYSLGHQVGRDFLQQSVKPSANALMQGVQDASTGKSPIFSPIEMYSLLVGVKKQIQVAKIKEKKQQAYLYRKQGREFLTENARRKDINTLASGLQYRIIQQGKGKSPKGNDIVTVKYRGTTIDGREFDSSYREGKPAKFQLNNLIPGWSQALKKMHEGDVWKIFVPTHLGYRSRGPLANRVLIYDVELIAVNESQDQQQSEGS